MTPTAVHAIFDIGKTNKKLFLFSPSGEILWNTSTSFPTIEDENDFPADDLDSIEQWMKDTISELMENNDWLIQSINFSGYGASLVYLDEEGLRLPLFINYLMPYPDEVADAFFDQYGPKLEFCRESASPFLGMLNSGLQIYWLKKVKPEWYTKVRYVLHFPQYLSYMFTGNPVAEFTSIGCHTGMWNYENQDYHSWIDAEEIRELLPPIMPSGTWMETIVNGRPVKVGTGLHDTSASLIPYLAVEKEPFLLLSTGTWAVCVNPFSTDALSREDLENDCLYFLGIEGQQVRSARLFLGREHEIQAEKLAEYYQMDLDDVLRIDWDPNLYAASRTTPYFPFEFEYLDIASPAGRAQSPSAIPENVNLSYYQLMDLLIPKQIEAIKRAAGSQPVRRLIIEGGFVHNAVFVNLLRHYLPDWEIKESEIEGGSARGVFELVNL